MGKSEEKTVEKTVENKGPKFVDWTYVWVAGDGSMRSAVFTCEGQPTIQRFDASATRQASTDNADLFLVPVRQYAESYLYDLTEFGSAIVLCEVQTADGTPHATNTRADLRKFLEKNKNLSGVKVGFEQDFLLIDPDTRQPYGWPKGKNDKGEEIVMFPGPQGRYYGGNGDFARGQRLVDSFYESCNWKNLPMRSYNAGICLSQWSYVTRETSILDACDDLIMRRFILEKKVEEETDPRCVVSYTPKSFPGTDWNGNGCTFRIYLDNYTKSSGNASLAKAICETIGEDHREHMAVYGAGNEQRLVGKSGGISDYNKFTWGFGDRTASVCVPTIPTDISAAKDFLFIEDRRPGAIVDPYAGALALSRSLTKAVELAPSNKSEAFEPKLVK